MIPMYVLDSSSSLRTVQLPVVSALMLQFRPGQMLPGTEHDAAVQSGQMSKDMGLKRIGAHKAGLGKVRSKRLHQEPSNTR